MGPMAGSGAHAAWLKFSLSAGKRFAMINGIVNGLEMVENHGG